MFSIKLIMLIYTNIAKLLIQKLPRWCYSCRACTTRGMCKIISTTEIFLWLICVCATSMYININYFLGNTLITNALFHGNCKNHMNPCFAKTFFVLWLLINTMNMMNTRSREANNVLKILVFTDLLTWSELEYKVLGGQVLPYIFSWI